MNRMIRLVAASVVFTAGFALPGVPTATADDGAACLAACTTTAAGCGMLGGGNYCNAAYEGCVAGCMIAEDIKAHQEG